MQNAVIITTDDIIQSITSTIRAELAETRRIAVETLAATRDESRGLSFNEAAARIGVSKPTFREMLKRGDLPYQRIGVKWVIPSDAVDTFLRGSE